MMKTVFSVAILAGAMIATASPAAAKQWQVKMLNKGSNGQLMAFEPAFVKIAPGDSVKFVAAQLGHNAETIPGMLPAGAAPFKGKINEEIVVTFAKPGLYGYKCLPHSALGMVGLIEVGDASNKAAIAAKAATLPGMAKKVMAGLVAQAR
jgi:pseudoazurin